MPLFSPITDKQRQRYANKFGLPADQVRYYEELTQSERKEVLYQFGSHKPENYVYAVKRAGGLVWRRVAR
jgi:hypothetical protein